MKRIALIGTHGTRKSTRVMKIASMLKEQQIEAGLLEEVARTTPFDLNEDRTESGQRWVLYTQLARETEKTLHGYEVLVCDRGTIDNYAYFTTAFGSREDLDDLVRHSMKGYSAIIRLPMINGGLTNDGRRSTDKAFQKEVDTEILKLLEKFNIPYTNWVSEDETVKYILEKCNLTPRNPNL